MKLVKQKKVINDKTFYNFYLELDNGNRIAVMPKTYVKADGTKLSTYQQLSTIAEYETK